VDCLGRVVDDRATDLKLNVQLKILNNEVAPSRLYQPGAIVVFSLCTLRVSDRYGAPSTDLACEVDCDYGEHSLERYADEIGVEYNTLRDYRTTSLAYPENAGRPANYGLARTLRAQPDRAKLVKTVSSVRAAVPANYPSALPASYKPG